MKNLYQLLLACSLIWVSQANLANACGDVQHSVSISNVGRAIASSADLAESSARGNCENEIRYELENAIAMPAFPRGMCWNQLLGHCDIAPPGVTDEGVSFTHNSSAAHGGENGEDGDLETDPPTFSWILACMDRFAFTSASECYDMWFDMLNWTDPYEGYSSCKGTRTFTIHCKLDD